MSNPTIDMSAAGARRKNAEMPGRRHEGSGAGDQLRVTGNRPPEQSAIENRKSSIDNPTDEAADVVRILRRKLDDFQRGRASRAGWTRRFIPTALPPLDEHLPHGGIPGGAVTEILSDAPGAGSLSLAMRIARKTMEDNEAETSKRPNVETPKCSREEGSPRSAGLIFPSRADYARQRPVAAHVESIDNRQSTIENPTSPASDDHRCIVVIDTRQDFYPPAAAAAGIPLDRLIVVRTDRETEALWAMEQSLRCPAIAAVIAPLTQLDERRSRRLQLAAESSGCIGLALRPARLRSRTFAAVQILVEGVPNTPAAVSRRRPDATGSASPSHDLPASSPRRLLPLIPCSLDPFPSRLTLLKVREGMPAGPIDVDLHHETDHGALHPIPLHRPAAKFA